jgi:hypothetical protein
MHSAKKYSEIIQAGAGEDASIFIPEALRGQQLLITIEPLLLGREDKLDAMKMAAADPLFQQDVAEITADFEHIDNEASED